MSTKKIHHFLFSHFVNFILSIYVGLNHHSTPNILGNRCFSPENKSLQSLTKLLAMAHDKTMYLLCSLRGVCYMYVFLFYFSLIFKHTA